MSDFVYGGQRGGGKLLVFQAALAEERLKNQKLRAALMRIRQMDNPIERAIVVEFRYEELLNPEETANLMVERLRDALTSGEVDGGGNEN